MIWTDGVISRYDVNIALRLLERKWKRVDSPIWVSADFNLDALGIIAPCFDTEADAALLYTRHAGFDIRINPTSGFADDDEIAGSIVHELVHAGQMERVGNDAMPRTSDWAQANADEDGILGSDATVEYYRIAVEREAKQMEIALVLGPMNRRYWTALLAESDAGLV